MKPRMRPTGREKQPRIDSTSAQVAVRFDRGRGVMTGGETHACSPQVVPSHHLVAPVESGYHPGDLVGGVSVMAGTVAARTGPSLSSDSDTPCHAMPDARSTSPPNHGTLTRHRDHHSTSPRSASRRTRVPVG